MRGCLRGAAPRSNGVARAPIAEKQARAAARGRRHDATCKFYRELRLCLLLVAFLEPRPVATALRWPQGDLWPPIMCWDALQLRSGSTPKPPSRRRRPEAAATRVRRRLRSGVCLVTPRLRCVVQPMPSTRSIGGESKSCNQYPKPKRSGLATKANACSLIQYRHYSMYTLQIIVSVCIFFPLTSSYTFHLITFATPSHKSAALRLAESAKRVGGFNRSFIYGMDALDPVFRQHNKRILSESRGAGYWIWKPYIILRHLFYEATSAEHVVCYSDALYEFKQNFTQTASKWVEQPPNVAVTVNKPSEKTFFEKAWTKKDAYIIMGL